ncbi:uncharacterized protein LOC105907157 isoform X1 [Clupea harengus]|uniref:Uncharacterized protein LOC105907157 isoform X1 n=2 Tax=Clupea harengus TaxID=7950 RepID=A0A6P8H0C2_CLUHA|nr:uncharacterized protein LOC105907157 isoform X1 [Clupea harengus]
MMNNGTSLPGRRPAVLTPYSNRTISHPTFMPIYQESLQRWSSASPPLAVMTPLDFYYTDPNLPPGSRIPNIVTKFEAMENFQLNTPAPIMSSQLAPLVQPDPFLSGTHPIRNLGTRSWTIDLCHRPHPYIQRPQTEGTLEVIQMSPAEDEAITSLLLLHHSTGTQQHKVKRSPSPGLVAQMQQHPVQSPSADVLSQGQEAVLTTSEIAPEASSLSVVTTTVNKRHSKEHCNTPQEISPSGLSEYHPELHPGSPEPSTELEDRPGLSLVAQVGGGGDSFEYPDLLAGVDCPLRPAV